MLDALDELPTETGLTIHQPRKQWEHKFKGSIEQNVLKVVLDSVGHLLSLTYMYGLKQNSHMVISTT